MHSMQKVWPHGSDLGRSSVSLQMGHAKDSARRRRRSASWAIIRLDRHFKQPQRPFVSDELNDKHELSASPRALYYAHVCESPYRMVGYTRSSWCRRSKARLIQSLQRWITLLRHWAVAQPRFLSLLTASAGAVEGWVELMCQDDFNTMSA